MKWIVGTALLLSVVTMLAGCTGADPPGCTGADPPTPPAGSSVEEPAAQPETQSAEQPAGQPETQPPGTPPAAGAAASGGAGVDSQKVAGAMGKALLKGFSGGAKPKNDSER